MIVYTDRRILTMQQDRFIELNVIEQVYKLGETSVIQNAWQKQGAPAAHGWFMTSEMGLSKTSLQRRRNA